MSGPILWGVSPPPIPFAEFVAARGPGLVRLATAISGDRALAEDLVQQVLGRAWTKWSRISRVDDPLGYVRQMVVREHLGWRRKRSSTERPSRFDDVALIDRVPGAGGADDHSARSADHHLLAGRLAALPIKQRAVLVLRYYEDLPDARIAEVLGCSDGTVRSWAARGLARLRAEIPEEIR